MACKVPVPWAKRVIEPPRSTRLPVLDWEQGQRPTSARVRPCGSARRSEPGGDDEVVDRIVVEELARACRPSLCLFLPVCSRRLGCVRAIGSPHKSVIAASSATGGKLRSERPSQQAGVGGGIDGAAISGRIVSSARTAGSGVRTRIERIA